MKKGRHRRFEEARALKRSTDFDVQDIFDTLDEDTGLPTPTSTAAENLDDDSDEYGSDEDD